MTMMTICLIYRRGLEGYTTDGYESASEVGILVWLRLKDIRLVLWRPGKLCRYPKDIMNGVDIDN
jgi:hypothetical protein